MAAAIAVNGGHEPNGGLDAAFAGTAASSHSQHGVFDDGLDDDDDADDAGESPAEIKKTVEAHLREIERQLQETQRLGTSLLEQHTEFTEKLNQVDEEQEAVPLELRKRLAQLGKDHDDVGREVARALLPRARTVSGDDKAQSEPGVYSNQGSSSPTKATAPSRRQRNQPSKHAGDLQFAADISTSLLAQVRQLQAAVAERDETIKSLQADHSRLDQDSRALSQKVRALDENEQRYKDENWNLETQNHHLQTAAREAGDREKRLNASLAAALAANARLQNEFDEAKLAHGKLQEDHAAAKKAHDTELHTLKRTVDQADDEKIALSARVDELTAQNQELALAINARFRAQYAPLEEADGDQVLDEPRELTTPEHSPPPSPTKATPRHPALESETLRSSLHHAHRMIQNLKNTIHREKTEKIELKRMLQDARDDLERSRDSPANATKRQRIKDTRRAPRPDLLGAGQRPRTDVELYDDDDDDGGGGGGAWEDTARDSPLHGRRILSMPGAYRTTDVSDAYATSTETEGAFETADEKQGTESEDFQTGAESLPEDSVDDLTETEDNTARARAAGTVRSSQPLALASKPAGDRSSFLSTASTSAGEEDGPPTPVLAQQHKFRLKNGRQSFRLSSRQAQADRGTPQSLKELATINSSSPATAPPSSPPAAEHSLYAELGDLDDAGSSTFGTPRQASLASTHSTPHNVIAPASNTRQTALFSLPASAPKPVMVDSGVMTEPLPDSPAHSLENSGVATTAAVATAAAAAAAAAAAGAATATGVAAAASLSQHRDPTPSDFPLPPSVPQSPLKTIDTSTQWTPQRSINESPARNIGTSITPPKTVWDQEGQSARDQEGQSVQSERLRQQFDYSGVLAQDTLPASPPRPQPVPAAVVPEHKFSAIRTWQIEPVSPQREISTNTSKYTAAAAAATAAAVGAVGAVGAGIFATAGAATHGLSTSKLRDVEDDVGERPRAAERTSGKRPLSSIDEDKAALGSRNAANLEGRSSDYSKVALTTGAARTALASDQPDGLGTSSHVNEATKDLDRETSNEYGRDSTKESVVALPLSPSKRPSSSTSQRTSSLVSQQHPPLPADHRSAIEKAGGVVTAPAVREPGPSNQTVGTMGPPALPASAMRRPWTPHEQQQPLRSPVREGTVSRASQARARAGTTATTTQASQTSRRSSISSFASELEERFNIRPNHYPIPQSFDPSSATDPRMIQAITQTMIGEFLWKYTRKAGRAEMSDTRHRRYFWVHPYTKTLYWSTHDPQTAARSQSNAKSVAIESVRVVTDDNPMPPGLHRKSLEVTTPSRKIKFTASTGQRHETWFNALSYLLLRGEHQADDVSAAAGPYVSGNTEITKDDVNEFNVYGNGYGARLVASGSRISMSSYNSRTTRGTTIHRDSARQQSQQLPAAGSGARASATVSSQSQQRQQATITANNNTGERRSRADLPREADKDRTLRASSVSRISRMIGSVTKRTSRSANPGVSRSETGSIYDASVVSDSRRDSAEDLRREMLRQEREGLGGGLENVRACCDGKHDVSTLSRGHSHRGSTPSTHGHRGISLRDTISRRTTGGN